MKKINFFFIYIIFCFSYINNTVCADVESFEIWLESFEKIALKKGVSKKTFDQTMSNVKFLPKVIEYDRYQPEFYEDTINFCHRWDQSSFDPNYDTISLYDFIPLVGKIFNRVPYLNL